MDMKLLGWKCFIFVVFRSNPFCNKYTFLILDVGTFVIGKWYTHKYLEFLYGMYMDLQLYIICIN